MASNTKVVENDDITYLNTVAILQELRELRQRIDDGAPAPRLTDGMPEVIIYKDPANLSSKLEPTTFPLYNGTKSLYPAWRRAIFSAIIIDWNTFGYNNARVFLMIYKALKERHKGKLQPILNRVERGEKSVRKILFDF